MQKLIILLLFTVATCSCLEEDFRTLEGNIFEEPNTTLFTLQSVSRDTITETRSDITITFTSSWADATPEQRSTITGLRINGPRTDRVFFYPAETTSHVLEFERHDLRRCLDFTFTTVDNTNTRTTELCFNP